MTNTPDLTSCQTLAARDGALSPFNALSYHFGMLLGVDDFAAEQAYHRGKMRLHNAWLHGAGVVWGFDVLLDNPKGEIRVKPGLALDGAGREIHLEGDACVNVGEWRAAQDPGLGLKEAVPFDAYVVARFKACLTRQVPALLEPCDGSGASGTAYSRIFETIDLRLVAGDPPAPSAPPYHALRVLFGLETPVLDDIHANEAAAKRNEILALAADQQPAAYLAALRHFAPFDEIQLKPDASDPKRLSVFPTPDDAPVVLATIKGLTVERKTDHWELTAGTVDVTVRPVLISTATIQELVCGPVFITQTGPRVLPSTVTITDTDISFEFDKPLQHDSVKDDAFSITTFADGTGWLDVGFNASVASDTPPKVNLHLTSPPLASGVFVRVIARGTGPRPLLGADHVPLAGDFVFMQQRS